MDLKKLDAYGVKNGIKRGMSLDEFCKKYECTVEELSEQLGRLYNHNKGQVKDLLVEMNLNGKKKQKKNKTKEAPAEDVDANPSATENVEGEESPVVDEAPEAMTVKNTQANIKEVEAKIASEIEELKKTELAQSDEVMELESQYKELATQRKTLSDELKLTVETAGQLKAAYEKKYLEFEALTDRFNGLVEPMNALSEKRCIKKAALEETRRKKEELSKITIFIYDDGSVSISDTEIIIPDDASSRALYGELISKPECEDLKLKEIKTLAKVLLIARNTSFTVEVICDNAELENVFKTLV